MGEPQVMSTLKLCLTLLQGRPLVVLADEIDAGSIDRAIDLGLRGVIPTRMASEVALAAIQFILAGGHYYPHSVPQMRPLSAYATCRVPLAPVPRDPAIWSNIERGDLERWPSRCGSEPGRIATEDDRRMEMCVGDRKLHLTQRQVDVMNSLERGLSNKAIGQELAVSESTVKLHVRHLLRKLGASNRTQIALMASSGKWEFRGS